jgi:diguanylate cyclase (GGDEF)-like protein
MYRKKGFPYVSFQALLMWCGILLILNFPGLWALEPTKDIFQFHLDTWKTGRGLPENTVYCLLQSRDGYIYLGTTKGLVRFDGVRFKAFDKKAPKQLSKSLVRSLYEDDEGNLWVGTDNGLIKYRDGKFAIFTTREGLPHNIIKDVLQDSERNTWICTDGGGITRFRDDDFFTYTARDGLASNFVKCIQEDSKGILWIGTRNGLSCLEDGKFILNMPWSESLSNLILSIFEDEKKNLWIGTHKGLKKLSKGNITAYGPADGIPDKIISHICQDRAGVLWIGTGAGLYRMKAGRFTAFTIKHGLSNNIVYSILEDREGSLWIGTLGGGLNRLKDVNFTTYTTKEGLVNNMARCVMEDISGALWIGTARGLSRLKHDKFNAYTVNNNSGPGNYIASMLEGNKGNLWLGTRDGLYRWKSGILSLFSRKKEWRGCVISSLFEDSTGNLWVGTLGGGLFQFKDNHWNAYTTREGLTHNKVSCIHEDSEGNLWIGTADGLNRLSGGEFTHYTTDQGLAHNEVNCIYEDAEGILWLGTRNGPTRLESGMFTPYHSHEDFLNNDIFVILEDNSEHLWMSSNKGIFRVRKKEMNAAAENGNNMIHTSVFGGADGMKSRICNGGTQPAGWKSRDGKLWFPTIEGAAMVDPDNLVGNDKIPPVLMEEIIVDGKEFDALPGQMQDKALFSPGVRNLEFHYTALSYLRPEKVYFKYQLKGYDENWLEAGTRRTAYYTNLYPGDYTFRVIACNNDGVWNEDGASFDFYLRPYIYQTTWFFVLCALIIVVSVAGFYTWRVRALKKHKKELEDLVNERTRQLKIANRKLSETNQELKRLASLDGLTGIYNYRWFSEFLEMEWKRAIRSHKPVTIILMDVDFFKLYNDTYGHQAGDDCLREIARKLKEECRRPGDVVARYGGDEFIVLLSNTPSTAAADIAERLWKGILQLKIPHEASRVSGYVTISLGCTTGVPKQKDEPAWLIRIADNALYESKKSDRNRVTIHVPREIWK